MNKKIFFALLLLPISLVMNGSDDDSFFENVESQNQTASSSVQQNTIQTNNAPRSLEGLKIYYGFYDNWPVQNNGQIIQSYQRSIPTNHINSGPIGRNVKNNQNNSAHSSVQEKRLVRKNLMHVYLDDDGEIVDVPNVITSASGDNNNLNTRISNHFVTTGAIQPTITTYQTPIPTNHQNLEPIGRNVQLAQTNENFFDMNLSDSNNLHINIAHTSPGDRKNIESPIENEGSPAWSLLAGINDKVYIERLTGVVSSRKDSIAVTSQTADSQPSLGSNNTRKLSFIYATPIINYCNNDKKELWKFADSKVETPIVFVDHDEESDKEHSQRYGRAFGEFLFKKDLGEEEKN